MNRDFKNALENFAFDAAAGRAIRHLHDIGKTPEEIADELYFPVPVDRIRKEIEAYEAEKYAGDGAVTSYERVYGKYGRSYFRKVKKTPPGNEEEL